MRIELPLRSQPHGEMLRAPQVNVTSPRPTTGGEFRLEGNDPLSFFAEATHADLSSDETVLGDEVLS